MMNKTQDGWVEDGDALEMTHLINKEMREGLTSKEKKRKAFLLNLFKRGK